MTTFNAGDKAAANGRTAHPDHGPWEARITGPVSLRALWWGPPAAVAEPDCAQPTVVFLHGTGDGADVWRPTMAAWPGGATGPMLALDLPGHGGSARLPQEDYCTVELVRIVGTALQNLGLASPIIVGHSLGARIALGLAASPCRPRLCVLVELGVSDYPEVDTAIANHIHALRTGAPTRDALIALVAERLPLGDPDALALAAPALAAAGPVAGEPASTAIDYRRSPAFRATSVASAWCSRTMRSFFTSPSAPMSIFRCECGTYRAGPVAMPSTGRSRSPTDILTLHSD